MDLVVTKLVLALFDAGERFALASTLETAGSSPRHAGAAMVVKTDGSIAGTIGGGALEAAAIRTALQVLDAQASRLMDYELTNADSAGLGMICGGRGRVLIEYVDPGAGATPELYQSLADLMARGGSGWLVTEVTLEDGRPVEPGTATDAGPLTVTRSLVELSGGLGGRPTGGQPGVYVQPVGLHGTAYVLGAGHCGKSLLPLLSMVGFRTVIVDDRAEFANTDRFPDADSIVVPASYESAFEMLPVDEQSYVVIMTRGHMFDRVALAQALRTPAAYVGMIGSKKKVAETFAALREEGFTDQDIARVRAPIGLDIGAETPDEIAVAIAAQIIQVRHS